jgi:hypothetical protein
VNIIPHTAWEDPAIPVTGPVPIKSKITTIPAHYTAMAVVPSNTKVVLRSIQRDYKLNRGYSIGYNFAIDKTGAVYECRGLKIKCAANVKCNDWTMAVLCLVDGSQPMNAKMVASFKELGAYIENYFGRSLQVVGHRDIGATACPGDGIYAQVKSGLLTPGDAPQPVPVPIPPQPPLPGGDDTVICIFESQSTPKEFNAVFYAECDAQARSIEMQWTGDGNDPRVMQRLAVMEANFGPRRHVSLAGIVNNRLHPKHKPSDINDDLHHWVDTDFAP